MGNDIVTDFSRAEGDRIVIEGHTTQIAEITYGDANGDGVMDHSIIEIYSDQGSGGGAHNDDRLGTITVYGDLIKESDIEHSASPAYGIVTTIEDLDDALKPTDNGENKVMVSKQKIFLTPVTSFRCRVLLQNSWSREPTTIPQTKTAPWDLATLPICKWRH
jgi:hypothetical protein